MEVPNQLQKAARSYRERFQLSIIPLHFQTKEPKVRTWKSYQQNLVAEATWPKWFEKPANIALIMGEVSGGLICRDFDVLEAYQRWARAFPQWAKVLPTVTTARGRHVYAKADLAKLRKHPQFNKQIFTFDDGELRCGGYCVAPPSIHPSGHVYSWVDKLPQEFPLVNPFECGFLAESTPCDREDVEHREDIENTREPMRTKDIHSKVVWQFGKEEEARIQEAIARTQPNAGGTRHRMIFELARELQAIEALVDCDPLDLEPFIRQWHQQAIEFITTKAWEDTWFDFLEGWDKVEHPAGQGRLTMLLAKVKEQPLPQEALQFDHEPLRYLVALCRELQLVAGNEPFFISARTAGRLFEVDHATAARWLKGLCKTRILRLVEQGTQSGRKASRYRYLR